MGTPIAFEYARDVDARAHSARRWLRLDAGYCALAGVLTIVLAAPLSHLFHAPSDVVAGLGVATLVWALLLVVVSRAERLERSVALVAGANGVVSAGLAALAAIAPALAARLLLLAVAIEVGAFAAVQARVARGGFGPL